MLFHLDFRVEYSAEMSQNDLFDIWSEEATAAVGAKKAGVVVDQIGRASCRERV